MAWLDDKARFAFDQVKDMPQADAIAKLYQIIFDRVEDGVVDHDGVTHYTKRLREGKNKNLLSVAKELYASPEFRDQYVEGGFEQDIIDYYATHNNGEVPTPAVIATYKQKFKSDNQWLDGYTHEDMVKDMNKRWETQNIHTGKPYGDEYWDKDRTTTETKKVRSGRTYKTVERQDLADLHTFQATPFYDINDPTDQKELVELEDKYIEMMYGEDGLVGKGEDLDSYGLDIRRVGMFDDDGKVLIDKEDPYFFETLTQGAVDWDWYQNDNAFKAAHSSFGEELDDKEGISSIAEIRRANAITFNDVIKDGQGHDSWRENWNGKYVPSYTRGDDGTILFKGEEIPEYVPERSDVSYESNLDTVVGPTRRPVRPDIHVSKVLPKRPSNIPPSFG